MKAVVWSAYGPPESLRVDDIPIPQPGENQVRVRVRATTVTAGDCEMRSLRLPLWLGMPMRLYSGVRKPTRITTLGMALAGEVESVGRGSVGFSVGQRVSAATGFGFGAYAEYAVVPSDGLIASVPDRVSLEEAALLPIGAIEAYSFLRKCNLRSGERVLVIGAGGSIGTFAVQLARLTGATITAVDRAEKLELLRSLGADEVVDYTRENYASTGDRYDIVVDVIGKAPFGRTWRLLRPGGRYVLANPRLHTLVRSPLISAFANRKVIVGQASEKAEDLSSLLSLVEEGELQAVIDRRFSLDEIVDAHRYAESGEKLGNIVVTVA